MAGISQFLNAAGFNNFEGNCYEENAQIRDLIGVSKDSSIKNILEIGFNAGHSACTFLSNNITVNVVSFDLGIHDYIPKAKEYIDETYPTRHSLILGDSTQTIPKYIIDNPDKKFDVIFIDGGHEYEVANADLENCAKLAHTDTIVLLDDTMFVNEWSRIWTYGPTKTWAEHLETNRLIEIARKNYGPGKGMCWGKYILSQS